MRRRGGSHPCVALAAGSPALGGRDGLYLAGYTIEHTAGVPALTGATTEFESLISEDGHDFYKLKRGQLLPGFSGSPLLDLAAGAGSGDHGEHPRPAVGPGRVRGQSAELAAAFPRLAGG